MQAHQTDFSSGNVYRNIIEVAVPMILAQLLNLLYNVVDRIYIGRIPEVGTTALTGVGLLSDHFTDHRLYLSVWKWRCTALFHGTR